MEKGKEIEFTELEDEMLILLNANSIHDDLCDTCLVAFLTDESKIKAINWLKENPSFNNVDISRLIGVYGIESEDFSLTTEFEEDDED